MRSSHDIRDWRRSVSVHSGQSSGIIADYLAQMCNTLRAALAPDAIMLGGGVMATPGLFERVIAAAAATDGGYFALPAARVIRRPALAPLSGLAGAFLLAADLVSAKR